MLVNNIYDNIDILYFYSYVFSKNKGEELSTMVLRTNSEAQLGGNQLSKYDIMQLNMLYNCKITTTTTTTTATTTRATAATTTTVPTITKPLTALTPTKKSTTHPTVQTNKQSKYNSVFGPKLK